MNTEILVIFEQKNGLFTDNCYNFKNKTLDFYKNIACNKGFCGGVEIIKYNK